MPRSNDVPLWTARAASLAMAGAWAVIAFGTAIDAVVKSKHDKEKVAAFAPPGATVNIDDSDVFQTGAVITAVSIVIFVITYSYLAILLIRPTSFTRSSILKIQGGILAFFATWLFATLVPYTHFLRTHSARVTAMIGNTQIPDVVVQTIQKQLGVTPVYKHIGYLRLVAILPWIELLFTIIASIVLFMAASRTRSTPIRSPVEGPTDRSSDEKEKVDSPTA